MKRSPNDPCGTHLFDKVPGEWWDKAACRGKPGEWFFPPNPGTEATRLAAHGKAVCSSCGVQGQCLEFALTEPAEQHGVWGGLTTGERRGLTNSAMKGTK